MDIQTMVSKYPDIINDGIVLEYIKEMSEKVCKLYYKGKDYKHELTRLVELINDFI